MDEVYIAVYSGECSISESIDDALKDLTENCTHTVVFEDVSFFRATRLKVHQTVIIDS
jgi:hypothetical protein